MLAGELVNIFDPALYGGAAYDLGVYCVSAMVELFGAPERVLAASVPIATGADGAGVALAVYPGLVVDVSYSKITASDRSNEVQGELGTLTFDHVTRPRSARVTLLDGTSTEHSFDGVENNMVYEVERFAALVPEADATTDQTRTLNPPRDRDHQGLTRSRPRWFRWRVCRVLAPSQSESAHRLSNASPLRVSEAARMLRPCRRSLPTCGSTGDAAEGGELTASTFPAPRRDDVSLPERGAARLPARIRREAADRSPSTSTASRSS